MTIDENIAMMEQIKQTLISEHDDFSRDDVQYDLDEHGNINNENDLLWHEERLDRDKGFTDAIKNTEDIIQMLTGKIKPETVFK